MPLLQLTVVHAVRAYSCLHFMTTQGLGRFSCSSSSSLVLSLEATVTFNLSMMKIFLSVELNLLRSFY